MIQEELIAKGICFKPPIDQSDSHPIHAPINLIPTPFSAVAFNRALELQTDFNLLVLRTVQNSRLLREVCGKLAEGDGFVANLYEIYCKYPQVPKLFFSVNRSDYMVEGDKIFQIELNTISASLTGLSTKLTEVQRLKHANLNIPENSAVYRVGESFEKVVQVYEREYQSEGCAILFIVQEDERNYFDQIHLQNSVNPKISILRKSLTDPEIFKVDGGILRVDGQEIALIYYRAGYSPDEYKSPKHWKSRDILESSRAVKCPDIASHLAGLKKIQQVLTAPDLLLETMKADKEATRRLQSSFAGIYSLDADTEEGNRNTQMACANPNKFVLKPQREGGGNNIYGEQVREALLSMSPTERSTFILMDRIIPSVNPTEILRNNQTHSIRAVSELGVYGVILAEVCETENVIFNEEVGWLLRTKPEESDEGGVVSGYSVIDVPVLQ